MQNHERRNPLIEMVLLLPAFVCLILFPAVPAAYGTSDWTAVGPDGGTIYKLAIDPRSPQTLYAGTEAGVFKSTNGGKSWIPVNRSMGGINALEIDPKSPRTIYAGTPEGIYKSTDGGESWAAPNDNWAEATQGQLESNLCTLAIDPASPRTLYAGTASPAGKLNGGVFKSVDGGNHWTAIEIGRPVISVCRLLIDPRSPRTLYAGYSDLSGQDHLKYGSRVLKTTDGGKRWTEADNGLTGNPLNGLVIDPVAPQRLYAAAFDGGVFRSTDGGENWINANLNLASLTGDTGSNFIYTLAIDRASTPTLYAGTRGGLLKSTDGGKNWAVIPSIPGGIQVHSVAIDPAAPQHIYAGTDDGLLKSTDGGKSWVPYKKGLNVTYVVSLAVDPISPDTLYAGTTKGKVFKSADGGKRWTEISPMQGATEIGRWARPIAIDPTSPQTLYAHITGTMFKSTDGGKSWAETDWNYGKEVTAIDSSGKEIQLTLKLFGVEALAIDPLEPQTFYTGAVGCGMFKSTNGGKNWTESGSRPNCTFVFSLTLDPASPQTLYAGTDAGVFKSTDGGESWTGSGDGLPADGDVLSLAIVPGAPQTVFAVLGPGYKRIDDESTRTSDGGIFKSTDGGHNWTRMDIDLPCGTAQAIAVDTAARTIYIGTSCGLFRHTDGNRD